VRHYQKRQNAIDFRTLKILGMCGMTDTYEQGIEKPGKRFRLMQHIRKRLVSGLLLLLPVGITFLILKFLFSLASGILGPLLERYVERYAGRLPGFVLPVVAILLLVIVMYFVGLFASLVIGRRMVSFGERILMRVPVLKTIYGASKQAVHVLAASDKTSFKSVVLVEFPRPGVRSFGFITGDIVDEKGHACHKVFVPTAPNPTTGFLIIVREKEVEPAGISVEEGVKMIVSGGILGPQKLGGSNLA